MCVGNHRKRILSLPKYGWEPSRQGRRNSATTQPDRDGESETRRERSIGTVHRVYRSSECHYRFPGGHSAIVWLPVSSIDPPKPRPFAGPVAATGPGRHILSTPLLCRPSYARYRSSGETVELVARSATIHVAEPRWISWETFHETELAEEVEGKVQQEFECVTGNL